MCTLKSPHIRFQSQNFFAHLVARSTDAVEIVLEIKDLGADVHLELASILLQVAKTKLEARNCFQELGHGRLH